MINVIKKLELDDEIKSKKRWIIYINDIIYLEIGYL